MATITWEIDNLNRELSDGYVNTAAYHVNGVDGSHSFKVENEVELPKPDTLVPYADLTESQVVGWVKARIGEIQALNPDNEPTVAEIEAYVEAGVNEKKTPISGVGKPW